MVERCSDDGRCFEEELRCEAAAGFVCSEGACVSACQVAADALAPAGCRFVAAPIYAWEQPLWADRGVYTLSPSPELFIINPDSQVAARVHVREGNSSSSIDIGLPAGTSIMVPLTPRTASTDESIRNQDSVISIESSMPIYVVHNFAVQGERENAQSGDASLLLPAHLLDHAGTRYRVITQPHRENHGTGTQPGGFVIASASPRIASIHIAVAGNTAPGIGLPRYIVGTSADLVLSPGEVIHFLSESPQSTCDANIDCTTTQCQGGEPCSVAVGDDLTGTLIESDEPVAVFNGGMSRVPWSAGYHNQNQLFEQQMPVALWGDEYVAHARRIPRGGGTFGHEKWLILTDAADNDITFDPIPPNDVQAHRLVDPGSFLTFNTFGGDFAGYRSFRLQTTKPVAVARYFYSGMPRGQAEGGSTYELERPRHFWRSSYALSAVGRDANRVLMVIPEGETATLDGEPIAAIEGLGPPGHRVSEMTVRRGLHVLEGSAPFGVLIYGYSVGTDESLGPGPRVLPYDSYSYSGPVGYGDR